MKQVSKKQKKPTGQMLEIEDLRIRLEEAEETLRAIRRGEIDGLIVEGAGRTKQVYTLKGADESYRILVEAMGEGALILSLDGMILYANKRFAEIVAAPLQKVIGGRVRDYIPDDLLGSYDALMGKSRISRVQQESALKRADGTLVPVQLSAGAMNLDETACIGLLVTDLTGQKEGEDEIRRHAAILETTNQELEAFVYSVSHDLRAPLRSVHRFSTLIQEDYGGVLDATAIGYLDRIAAEATRMDDLIRDLLTYSGVSRQVILHRTLDSASVVAEVLKQLGDDLRECRAEVVVDTPLPAVMGDGVLLSQVVTNLITNSIKFVPPGVDPRVRLRAEHRGPLVRLWVEDNGIGIAPDQQGRLFRLFERLNQDYRGTGVGLAIVKRAVERMGGHVGVESSVGKGSRFWVELQPPKGGTP